MPRHPNQQPISPQQQHQELLCESWWMIKGFNFTSVTEVAYVEESTGLLCCYKHC